MNRISGSLIALFCSISLYAAPGDFQRALSLYNNGLYAQAMDLFQSLPEYGNDGIVDGYVVLCAQKQHTLGYEKLVQGYLSRYSTCTLCKDVRMEQAFDLFDKGMYSEANDIFAKLSVNDYEKKLRPEYLFKKGYSNFKLGRQDQAISDFNKVVAMEVNDYTAPSEYVTGYILYGRGEFQNALQHFQLATRDERMAAISNYYIINCRYELKDYDFVISDGVKMFENDLTPADRKAHLARIISESYLVKGDKQNARKFYSDADDGSQKSRADYFYAGSLMFATGEYQNAVENYAKMTDKTDSLGQIALYQTALSYVNLKNKVAALDSFKGASALQFDPKMTEDAFFNYAKLAFDLNGDTKVFADYIKTYSDKVRGEKIYSYMALTALADKDYQSAIDAYDRIDVLEGQERNNYVHANYLRGAELLDAGSYRKAAQCMKAVTYYTERGDLVNQLARYALADSYYRNGQYDEAQKQYSDLYNSSALYGLPQAELMTYNVGYSYFKQEDYGNAARWFGNYINDGGKTYAMDAAIRRADCHFGLKAYQDAAVAYQEVTEKYPDLGDLYPYYQAALCYGLSSDGKNRKTVTANRNKKIEILKKAQDADPKAPYYAESLFELGRTLQEAGRKDDAVATFTTVTERVPSSPFAAQALLEIGTIKRNSGNSNAALEAYKKVVETMQDSGYSDDALLAIESIYQSQNAPQKYIAYIESIGKGASKTDAERESMIYNAAEQIYFADNFAKALVAFQEFQQAYPASEKLTESWYYIGESYRQMDDKERACDAYAKVMAAAECGVTENAMRQYAALSYSMENYEDALKVYQSLSARNLAPAYMLNARQGLMRSAFKAKDYETSIAGADVLLSDAQISAENAREAKMTKARSLLATSRRDEAFALFGDLASDMKSAEGAEAAYLVIQDCFDRADFDSVRDKVYAMSDSGTTQQYFLAKAFIVLGDSFAEQGKMKQAKATFQSIADGYSENAEINEELQVRLQKLEEIK